MQDEIEELDNNWEDGPSRMALLLCMRAREQEDSIISRIIKSLIPMGGKGEPGSVCAEGGRPAVKHAKLLSRAWQPRGGVARGAQPLTSVPRLSMSMWRPLFC